VVCFHVSLWRHSRVGNLFYESKAFLFSSAPEIDTDLYHDILVDSWSLGAILYTMLCGIPPFKGEGDDLVVNKLTGAFDFEIVQPSGSAQNLIAALLQVIPSDRIPLEEIVDHPWMKEDDGVLIDRALPLTHGIFQDWETPCSADFPPYGAV
jgi:serine/threonine protein kinase